MLFGLQAQQKNGNTLSQPLFCARNPAHGSQECCGAPPSQGVVAARDFRQKQRGSRNLSRKRAEAGVMDETGSDRRRAQMYVIFKSIAPLA